MSRYSQTSSLTDADEERSPTARYNMPGSGRREVHETTGIEVEKKEEEEEHEVDDLRDRMKSSRGSQKNLINRELGFEPEPAHRISGSESVINGIRDLSKCMVIYPDNRYVLAAASSSDPLLSLSLYFLPLKPLALEGPRTFSRLGLVRFRSQNLCSRFPIDFFYLFLNHHDSQKPPLAPKPSRVVD